MPPVRVPQQGGTISVAVAGGEPTTRTVGKDGVVNVADEDLEHFLAVVPGAELVEDSKS